MLFNLTNPIPAALRDPEILTAIFTKYGIIPYYGDEDSTSHATLQVLADVAGLSPSYMACKSDLQVFAFGEQVNIAAKKIPGLLDTEQEPPLPFSKKVEFSNWLESLGINLLDVIEITRELFSDRRDTGNAYLKIKIVTVGGTIKVFLDPVDPLEAAYLRTMKLEDPVMVTTKYWDEEYWKKKPPTLTKVSYLGRPYSWSKRGGTLETILHLKTGKGYYGRPKILPLINWMYAEYEMGNLAAKTASTEFTAKHLVFFEETDPSRFKGDQGAAEADFRKRMQALRLVTTNEGDFGQAKSLVGMEYPYGQKPPDVHPLEVNRDTAHMEKTMDMVTTLVYASQGWSKELTGVTPIKGGIGSNILIDLFNTKNVSTVYPIQSYYENVWADVFRAIAEQVGYTGETYTVQFPDLISSLVQSLKEFRSTGSTTLNEQLNKDEDQDVAKTD